MLANALLILGLLVARATGYFVITKPVKNTEWVNGGEPQLVSWRKGVQDGLDYFDVEMARMGSEGLTLIARNVPTVNTHSFYLSMQDIPPADDYYLIFINSTHGVMHKISEKFTILPAGSPTTTTPTTIEPRDANVLTLTASGAPNPTRVWGTVLPAWHENGVGQLRVGALVSVGVAVLATTVVGGMWTLL